MRGVRRLVFDDEKMRRVIGYIYIYIRCSKAVCIYTWACIYSLKYLRYISGSVAEPFGINMSLSRGRWTDISRRVHKRGEAIIRFILRHGRRIQSTRTTRSLDHVRTWSICTYVFLDIPSASTSCQCSRYTSTEIDLSHIVLRNTRSFR